MSCRVAWWRGAEQANEDQSVVAAVSRCDRPMASIFGNHDAQRTLRAWHGHHTSSWYRQRAATRLAEGATERPEFSSESLERLHRILETSDVGFRFRRYDDLTVVGARPFSRGGPRFLRPKSKFYKAHWRKVACFETAADRIVQNCEHADGAYVVLAHNGPSGFGSSPTAFCGKDWGGTRADWGDPDLEMALRRLAKKPLFVASGHMHSPTEQGECRTMFATTADGVPCVNAAVFPRWRRCADGRLARAFTLVDLLRSPEGEPPDDDWRLETVVQTWLVPSGEAVSPPHVLFNRSAHGGASATHAA